MKCNHSNHPVVISFGFLNENSNGDNEGRMLFVDGGKIGGMIHCANCGALRMFTPDREMKDKTWNEKSFLQKT